MTVQANPVLRAVVLPATDAHPQDTPTRRLLDELGHDVTRANSTDHALQLMGTDRTDLLVVDITNSQGNREIISRMDEIEPDHMPREVAIFTDRTDAQLTEFRKRLSPSHVHIFLKPLHVHGLLNVLRQLERKHK